MMRAGLRICIHLMRTRIRTLGLIYSYFLHDKSKENYLGFLNFGSGSRDSKLRIRIRNLGCLKQIALVWQADPGAWELSLRAGRSNDIYEIVSHENTDSDKNSKDIAVLVNRWG